MCKGTCRRKFRNHRRRRLEVAEQLPHISCSHLEKVYSNLRQQLKRKPEDKMEDFDVDTLLWGMFMIVTQQAAVHLGIDYLENLRSTKHQHSETI